MRKKQTSRLPDVPVEAGERVLAGAVARDGVTVVGTRDALYLSRVADPTPTRIPWEQVEAADWDTDTSILRVAEVGTWGASRPEHHLEIEEPGRLAELVRERVTASVVLQRHVPIRGRRGVFVIARRAPFGDRPVQWVYEFEEGIDPGDPDVRCAAEEGLAAAQNEVGLT